MKKIANSGDMAKIFICILLFVFTSITLYSQREGTVELGVNRNAAVDEQIALMGYESE